MTWCNTYPDVSQRSVAVGSWGDPFLVSYSIPWGDEAYPVLFNAPRESVHSGETSEPGVDRPFLEGRLDLSTEQGGGGLRVHHRPLIGWSDVCAA